MTRRAAFIVLATFSLVLALGFLILPVVAIFARTSPARLLSRLGDPVAQDALRLSLETSALAVGAIVLVGTPAAYLLATRRFRGRSVVITLIELPLVLPPAVAGIGLLAALGPRGILGGGLASLHLQLVLQTAGVVVASAFVSAPLYVRSALSAFVAVPESLREVSRTLGRDEPATVVSVMIPVALPGLAAGLALAGGRALGEFGATLMFAGSFRGVTQTVPLAIYDQFSQDLPAALALSGVLVAVSAAVLLAVKLVPDRSMPVALG